MAPSNLCGSLQWDHVLLPCPEHVKMQFGHSSCCCTNCLPASRSLDKISPKFGQMFDNSYTNHWIFSETYMTTVFRNQVCTLYVCLIYIYINTWIYWYTMIGLVCCEPFNALGFPSCTSSNEVYSIMKLFSRCRFGPPPVQSLAMTWALALPPKKYNAETNYATSLFGHMGLYSYKQAAEKQLANLGTFRSPLLLSHTTPLKTTQGD